MLEISDSASATLYQNGQHRAHQMSLMNERIKQSLLGADRDCIGSWVTDSSAACLPYQTADEVQCLQYTTFRVLALQSGLGKPCETTNGDFKQVPCTGGACSAALAQQAAASAIVAQKTAELNAAAAVITNQTQGKSHLIPPNKCAHLV